ncbi:WYL domain-containing protein [Paenibacillus glycanilyticus]|uniref:WYL domain-containing protein n=1 Tax=Paenibacillus glycanilyticus TaxID=126569 RepID=UPI002041B449|nr:WYL domain-containing protein [Paenibacillus glycanilyticus]MCM3629365.1 WYL domain-containing protein [Paenibacillus glycanilyticus]
MNLFEKIFNYRMMAQLDEHGALAVTAQERRWLLMMLEHPDASSAIEPETLDRLRQCLCGSDEPSSGHFRTIIIEKAGSTVSSLYHPLMGTLRRMIVKKSGMQLLYTRKDGTLLPRQAGVPYKLEYSMVKKEWYLLWYNRRTRSLMTTRLRSIRLVEDMPVSEEFFNQAAAALASQLEKRTQHATIEIIPAYNRELSRILYALSCFDKQVQYDEPADTYAIKLTFLGDETEYVLSKLRFLGLRVRVTDHSYMKYRLREAAQKSLARYGYAPSAIETAQHNNGIMPAEAE